MEPEDEAFEELALKQGHWQHTSGWRKKQIMETSMTKDEIDIMWQQAMKESIKNNEMYTRYHFAKLVAAKERLAQPEPIQSLQCFHCQVTIETLNDKVMHLLAQRKPLTNGEINTAYITATNQTLRATDERLAFAFARAIEAAHGIKENT